MQHLDPELLSLLALGEDAASPEERAHLRDCPECGDERDRLQRAVDIGRTLGDVRFDQPHARVWGGISADLGLAAGLRDDPLGPPAVVPLAARRGRRRAVLLLVAATVVVLAGVGAGVAVWRGSTVPLATATLRAFPGWDGERGTATLERRGDGQRIVELTTSVQPGTGTDHEVWLMTANAKRLVSLGLLRGTSGSFVVPAGVDLDRYDLVDVSDEPRDGDTAHSGDSILRGELHS